jgi:hypothetical protein
MAASHAANAPIHSSLTRFIDTVSVDFGAGAGGGFGPSLSDGLDKTRSPLFAAGVSS